MVRGTSSGVMLIGIVIFFVMQITAIGLALMGGTAMDIIVSRFVAMGWYSVSPAWDTSAQVELLINLFYVVPVIISLAGIYVLVVTILHRTANEDEDEYYVSGGP